MGSGERRVPDLEGAVQDCYEALTGIGVELEALVRLARFAVRQQYGRDVLAGTDYAEDRGGDVEPPPWANGPEGGE